MSLRHVVGRTVATVLLAGTAFVSVGLTAPPQSPFSIRIHTALINLSVDVDVKVGDAHFHRRWSALPEDSKL